ncbi:hypothetical protein DdX_02164 [Ditylenchus destructor]|uniref:Secreted protein n=1 Tax=Ditylenchus destructor TaxID=166010 RepID=A0AAD4NDN7_9BILA|nr:hypothetical protein DdX_02164 [Ditylenchus destructor]
MSQLILWNTLLFVLFTMCHADFTGLTYDESRSPDEQQRPLTWVEQNVRRHPTHPRALLIDDGREAILIPDAGRFRTVSDPTRFIDSSMLQWVTKPKRALMRLGKRAPMRLG